MLSFSYFVNDVQFAFRMLVPSEISMHAIFRIDCQYPSLAKHSLLLSALDFCLIDVLQSKTVCN